MSSVVDQPAVQLVVTVPDGAEPLATNPILPITVDAPAASAPFVLTLDTVVVEPDNE